MHTSPSPPIYSKAVKRPEFPEVYSKAILLPYFYCTEGLSLSLRSHRVFVRRDTGTAD